MIADTYIRSNTIDDSLSQKNRPHGRGWMEAYTDGIICNEKIK